MEFMGLQLDLTDPSTRYFIALTLLTVCLIIVYRLVNGPTGRALIAIRENEDRTRMLGYNTFAIKLKAVVISGTLSAAAGATYALLFAYIGSTFASFQYSIDALLFTPCGGRRYYPGPIAGQFHDVLPD